MKITTELELIEDGWTVYLAHNGEKPYEVGLFVEDKDGFDEEKAKRFIVRLYHLVKDEIDGKD